MSKKTRSLLAVFLAMAVCLGVLQQFQMKASAQVLANTITLTYEVGEGTGDSSVSLPIERSDTVTSKALTFNEASEWSKMNGGTAWTAPTGKVLSFWLANDENLTQYLPGDAIPVDGSVTVLTAIYENSAPAGTFTLTYMVGEGTGSNAVSDPLKPSSTATSEALTFNLASLLSQSKGGSIWTAPAGKTFSYWLANDENLTHYLPGDAIPLDGSVTALAAIYESSSPAGTFTLTYTAGEGTGGNAVSDQMKPSSTATSEALTFNLASIWAQSKGGSTWTAPAGKTFSYWLANDENLTHYLPGDAIPVDGSVTFLTAIYESSAPAGTFTLTYTAGEGAGGNAVSDPLKPSSTATSEALTFNLASLWSQSKGGSTWTAPVGKTFSYWLANDENLTHYLPGDAIPLDGSVTELTAFYEVPAAKGLLQIANKALSGGTLSNGQFSFTLTPLVPTVPGNNGYYTKGNPADVLTLKNDAKGAVCLDQDTVFTQQFHDKYCYDSNNTNNIYNGAYAFLLQEVNENTKGYTYDTNSYFISVVFSDGKLLDVSAQKYQLDNNGHYVVDSSTDVLFTLSDILVLSNSTAKKGYVTFNNMYSSTSGGGGSGSVIDFGAGSSGTESQSPSSTASQTVSSAVSSGEGSQAASSVTNSNPGSNNSETESKAGTNAAVPATGDSTNTVVWVVLMGLSVGGFLVLLLASKSKIK